MIFRNTKMLRSIGQSFDRQHTSLWKSLLAGSWPHQQIYNPGLILRTPHVGGGVCTADEGFISISLSWVWDLYRQEARFRPLVPAGQEHFKSACDHHDPHWGYTGDSLVAQSSLLILVDQISPFLTPFQSPILKDHKSTYGKHKLSLRDANPPHPFYCFF